MFFSDRHEKKKDPDFSPEPVEETEKVQEDETKEDFFFKYTRQSFDLSFYWLLHTFLYDSSAVMQVSWTLRICPHDISSPDKHFAILSEEGVQGYF